MKRRSSGYASIVLLLAMLPAGAARAQEGGLLEQWLRDGPATRDLGGNAMGALPSTAAEMATWPHFAVRALAPADRPARLDLRDGLPPVGDQGKQGSCGCWAVAYYCYGYLVAQRRALSAEQRAQARFEFSPAYLYHQCKAPKGGTTFPDDLKVLRNQGCATMAEMPYRDDDDSTDPSADARRRAATMKALGAACLFRGKPEGGAGPDLEQLKTFLAETQGPFVMGIAVFKDFPMGDHGKVGPDFVYHLTVPGVKANFLGGHAITVVGYDDDRHAFLIVNQWGTAWGHDGFLWLGEDFVRDWAAEAWGILPGGIQARQPTSRIDVIEPDKG
jgi:hypothetical protein